jgi:hypothetical protein
MILYLSAPVAADTYTAKYFAHGSALAAGYHVVTVDSPFTNEPAGPVMSDPIAVQCQEEREQRMSAELRRVGAYSPADELLDHDTYVEVRLRFEVDQPCPGDPVYRVADSTQPVHLTLSGPQNPNVFF